MKKKKVLTGIAISLASGVAGYLVHDVVKDAMYSATQSYYKLNKEYSKALLRNIFDAKRQLHRADYATWRITSVIKDESDFLKNHKKKNYGENQKNLLSQMEKLLKDFDVIMKMAGYHSERTCSRFVMSDDLFDCIDEESSEDYKELKNDIDINGLEEVSYLYIEMYYDLKKKFLKSISCTLDSGTVDDEEFEEEFDEEFEDDDLEPTADMSDFTEEQDLENQQEVKLETSEEISDTES